MTSLVRSDNRPRYCHERANRRTIAANEGQDRWHLLPAHHIDQRLRSRRPRTAAFRDASELDRLLRCGNRPLVKLVPARQPRYLGCCGGLQSHRVHAVDPRFVPPGLIQPEPTGVFRVLLPGDRLSDSSFDILAATPRGADGIRRSRLVDLYFACALELSVAIQHGARRSRGIRADTVAAHRGGKSTTVERAGEGRDLTILEKGENNELR